MILDIFQYFARFPAKEGVLKNFTNGSSHLSQYATMKENIRSMSQHDLLPELQDYVFAMELDVVKHRVNEILGTYLFVDFGELSSSRNQKNSFEDTVKIAVTVAQKAQNSLDSMEYAIINEKTLQLINQLRAHIYADARSKKITWLQDLSGNHNLAPFISKELSSVGWTIILTLEGSDILNLKQLINEIK